MGNKCKVDLVLNCVVLSNMPSSDCLWSTSNFVHALLYLLIWVGTLSITELLIYISMTAGVDIFSLDRRDREIENHYPPEILTIQSNVGKKHSWLGGGGGDKSMFHLKKYRKSMFFPHFPKYIYYLICYLITWHHHLSCNMIQSQQKTGCVH